jgi:EAL domain-containing protein (putative c-di-GMP-specific phosphodiesterase class I)
MVDDSIDAASLLAEAESACRSAQHGGVRRIVTMDANSTVFQRRRNELRLASLLSLALDNDSVEITLGRMHALSAPDADPPHFEVQIAVRDEAGQALPTERLAVAAERFGLQSALDRWVVSTLLPRLVADSRAGALPPNAVLVLRLSAQSIAEAGTLTFLRRRIVESGIEPARIVFRVSESAVLARAVPSIRLFAGLRQLGCKLMIDEVGGGQSSFAYLKNVGVDYVALDRDLVPAAMRERTERAMLAAVMRLSEMLDMRTVAPAVADVTELAALRDMGIDFAMGSSSAIAKASA